MIPAEVTKLCRYIKAACPSQAMDEFTPDVWAEILPTGYTLGECRAAVIAIKQRQPYVDVSDVIAEVKRARRASEDRERIHKLLDPAAYRAEVADADTRTLALISSRRKTLAITGPAPEKPAYIGPALADAAQRAAAARQAAQSRAGRQERETAS